MKNINKTFLLPFLRKTEIYALFRMKSLNPGILNENNNLFSGLVDGINPGYTQI